MARDLWQDALDALVKHMKAGMSPLEPESPDFEDFVRAFERDFTDRLPPSKSVEAAEQWAKDGRAVLQTGEMLGAVAKAFAGMKAEGDGKITKDVLVDALNVVRDRCGTEGREREFRKKYCERVP